MVLPLHAIRIHMGRQARQLARCCNGAEMVRLGSEAQQHPYAARARVPEHM